MSLDRAEAPDQLSQDQCEECTEDSTEHQGASHVLFPRRTGLSRTGPSRTGPSSTGPAGFIQIVVDLILLRISPAGTHQSLIGFFLATDPLPSKGIAGLLISRC